jgi:hypothetical protein
MKEKIMYQKMLASKDALRYSLKRNRYDLH